LVTHFRQKRDLTRQRNQLWAEHDLLSREIARIEQDPSYTEYLIRKDLGYVKTGEVEYRFTKKRS